MKYENVKIGDEFFIASRYKEGIYNVTKVTPTRFECGDLTWNKKNGYQVGGDSWHGCIIRDITYEEKQDFILKIKKKKLISKLSEIKYEHFSIDQLIKIQLFISDIT